MKAIKNIEKKVCAVIFCITTAGQEITFNEVFSGKYEDEFLLHTGLYTGEVLRTLTNVQKKYITDFIESENILNS